MSETPSRFLELRQVQAVYGASVAVRDVSLQVQAGSIVALLGANGAGKSTTLKAISNLLGPERGRVSQGSIRWNGISIDQLSAAQLVQAGVVQVLEGRHVFAQLSVEENLLSGGFLHKPSRALLQQQLEQVYQWFPRLRDKRSTKAGLTSGGEQQMVAIGRALMTQPKLVLLDEPSMGLAPIIVQEIFEIIRQLNSTAGVSFLLAEQNANLALRYADYAYILESGRVALEGPAKTLLARDDVHEFYLGAELAPA
ncbi:MAG: ABC transporter ATP-binding protein [Burkholderiales bacterium]|nr:ABC transporter ATP-binding protein [Burkholderiales bacterium]